MSTKRKHTLILGGSDARGMRKQCAEFKRLRNLISLIHEQLDPLSGNQENMISPGHSKPLKVEKRQGWTARNCVSLRGLTLQNNRLQSCLRFIELEMCGIRKMDGHDAHSSAK
jgi:hypothetical protein